jgi:hypothetical protein
VLGYAIIDAVARSVDAEPSRGVLLAYLTDEIIPHPRVEERPIYNLACGAGERSLIAAMELDRQALLRQVARTTTPTSSATEPPAPPRRRCSSSSPRPTCVGRPTCSPPPTPVPTASTVGSRWTSRPCWSTTEATVAQARMLHATSRRPNIFIKIPGTAEGLPAIEECIFAGVPINVTLLFSAEQYQAAAEAYLRGIELGIAVASRGGVKARRQRGVVRGLLGV